MDDSLLATDQIELIFRFGLRAVFNENFQLYPLIQKAKSSAFERQGRNVEFLCSSFQRHYPLIETIMCLALSFQLSTTDFFTEKNVDKRGVYKGLYISSMGNKKQKIFALGVTLFVEMEITSNAWAEPLRHTARTVLPSCSILCHQNSNVLSRTMFMFYYKLTTPFIFIMKEDQGHNKHMGRKAHPLILIEYA